MDRRLTRSRAKDIANEVPVHPDVAPTNEEAPTQTTKALKSRKREPEQPKQPEHDDTQQEEDAHKDKKAKSMAASSSIKSIPVLKVGDTIPDVELLDDEGKSVTLHGIVKDAGAVFFIYPRANTPGCTKQACGFRDHYEEFVKDGFVPYGLSSDKPTAQANWKKKHKLPFNLLCDPKLEAIKAFGALKAPSSAKRSHIVVEKGGRVRDIRIQISPSDSVSESLQTVQK